MGILGGPSCAFDRLLQARHLPAPSTRPRAVTFVTKAFGMAHQHTRPATCGNARWRVSCFWQRRAALGSARNPSNTPRMTWLHPPRLQLLGSAEPAPHNCHRGGCCDRAAEVESLNPDTCRCRNVGSLRPRRLQGRWHPRREYEGGEVSFPANPVREQQSQTARAVERAAR